MARLNTMENNMNKSARSSRTKQELQATQSGSEEEAPSARRASSMTPQTNRGLSIQEATLCVSEEEKEGPRRITAAAARPRKNSDLRWPAREATQSVSEDEPLPPKKESAVQPRTCKEQRLGSDYEEDQPKKNASAKARELRITPKALHIVRATKQPEKSQRSHKRKDQEEDGTATPPARGERGDASKRGRKVTQEEDGTATPPARGEGGESSKGSRKVTQEEDGTATPPARDEVDASQRSRKVTQEEDGTATPPVRDEVDASQRSRKSRRQMRE